jgi:hypothetical protein
MSDIPSAWTLREGTMDYNKHNSFRFYLGTKCGWVFSSRLRQWPLFKVILFTPKG